ncbi:MAG: hypothetical protein HZB41_05265 [Ignavibacteriae bacterium]|nr:hypothetical protein [Ignavibacteriota bacterium]
MKKILLFMIALIVIYPLSAFSLETRQDTDDTETLFGSGEITHGGYGAPELKLTQIQGEMGLLVGGRGGWIINSTFSIGGGGYGLVTSHKISNYKPPFDTAAYLRVGYGGIFFEYINSSNKLIHFTVNTLIGAGGASYTRSIYRVLRTKTSWVHQLI